MAKIVIKLFIESADLSVEDMTARLGLPPDKSWRIGESRGVSGKKYLTNCWSIQSRAEPLDDPLTVATHVRDNLSGLFERIKPKLEQFRALTSGRVAGLYVGITCSAIPPLIFSAQSISDIGELGVDFEVDLTI